MLSFSCLDSQTGCYLWNKWTQDESWCWTGRIRKCSSWERDSLPAAFQHRGDKFLSKSNKSVGKRVHWKGKRKLSGFQIAFAMWWVFMREFVAAGSSEKERWSIQWKPVVHKKSSGELIPRKEFPISLRMLVRSVVILDRVLVEMSSFQRAECKGCVFRKSGSVVVSGERKR